MQSSLTGERKQTNEERLLLFEVCLFKEISVHECDKEGAYKRRTLGDKRSSILNALSLLNLGFECVTRSTCYTSVIKIFDLSVQKQASCWSVHL